MSSISDRKILYRTFCQEQEEVPLFFQPWWLDLVCDKGIWDVCIVQKNDGTISGVLPFYQKQFLNFKYVQMPMLTPYLGAWLIYPKEISSTSKKLKFEHNTYKALIDQLPSFLYYAQRHPTQLNNWVPFYWKGYQQNTRYTYIIKSPIVISSAFDNLKDSNRNTITKAQGHLQVNESDSMELFYELNTISFSRQSKKPPYNLAFLKKIDDQLSKKQQRKILIASDESGLHHGGIYLAWDTKTMYCLMIGADTALRSSGAVPLLIWEGIQLASKLNLNFDFEGSMMPNIEGVFRRFGGELTPYFKLFKEGNRFLRILNGIRSR